MRQLFDKDKANPSIGRLRHAGNVFEIVIDPENALKLRRGESDVASALLAPHIYKDAKTGELASEELMQELFKTSDERKVAERIIIEGELHFNEEYKENLRNEKKAQILSILSKEAADVNTGLPVDEKRLQSALTKANVHIDLYKKVEDQMPEIVSKLKSVMALTLEKKRVLLRIPSQYGPKLYGYVASKSHIIEESWQGDGSLRATVELSAGAVAAFVDELKKATHGGVETTIESPKRK